jgi:endo-1,4-beta-xylanase
LRPDPALLKKIKEVKVMKRYFLLLTACTLIVLGSCKPVYNPPVQSVVPSLAEKYADYFPIGSMIKADLLEIASDTAIKHCSIVTFNTFLFNRVHPQENIYYWDDCDKMIGFARAHSMKIRGHTLIYDKTDPEWIFKDNNQTVSREVLIERMKQHIQTIVGRYKGQVDNWDVVNEATADIFGGDCISDIYKRTRWQQIIGDEYIELAFRFAHEADPNAKLFFNENYIEGSAGALKRQRLYSIVKGLLAKGVPIHGIGIQGHWEMNVPDVDEILSAIDLFASLGLEVQITELDISFYPLLRWYIPALVPKIENFTEDMSLEQAWRYHTLFNGLRTRKEKLTGVVFWGLSDDISWLRFMPDTRNDWPLLFDGQYQPKKAFWAVVDFQ